MAVANGTAKIGTSPKRGRQAVPPSPPVSSSDNGKVLTVVGGNWTPVGKDIDISILANTRIQPIPILFNPNPGEEEFYFTVELTPKDVMETGYTLSYEEFGEDEEITLNIQPEAASSYAVAYIYTSDISWYDGSRVSLLLADNAANVDGTIFQTGIFDLSGIGFMDMVGYFVLQPEYGYEAPYRCHLIYWEAQMM